MIDKVAGLKVIQTTILDLLYKKILPLCLHPALQNGRVWFTRLIIIAYVVTVEHVVRPSNIYTVIIQ